jgi:hypothetical protein
VVEHLPDHLKVMGMSLEAIAGTRRGNGQKVNNDLPAAVVQSVVEHLPHAMVMSLEAIAGSSTENAHQQKYSGTYLIIPKSRV